MRLTTLAAMAFVLHPPMALAWEQDCRVDSAMNEAIAAAGIDRVEVDAKAGSLEIDGIDGATSIDIEALACASTQELADSIEWGIERNAKLARVWVEIPEHRDREYARLSLKIRVPAGIDTDVSDTSGSVELRRVGALRLRDGSGSVVVEGASGPVIIDDGSGSIKLRNVEGPVEVRDGSGSIEIVDVRRSVRLTDSSGGISVRSVGGDVEVLRDGSGGISVADVAGDFAVLHDGSGGITHRGVAGAVRLPR